VKRVPAARVPPSSDPTSASRTIDPADVALVEQMLDLNRRLAEAKAAHEKEVFAGMIDATDRRIDRLVYELYGLMEEEIAVVEGAA